MARHIPGLPAWPRRRPDWWAPAARCTDCPLGWAGGLAWVHAGLARYSSLAAPKRCAACSTWVAQSRLSRIRSAGARRFRPMPPALPAAYTTQSGRSVSKNASTARWSRRSGSAAPQPMQFPALPPGTTRTTAAPSALPLPATNILREFIPAPPSRRPP